MSFNVRLFNHYNWIKSDSIAEKISEFSKVNSPDVLSLQEFHNDYKYLFNHYKNSHFGLNGENVGLALFSNKKIVKKGNIEELSTRMDIIPTSIALAQAAKESGWGTSRFALEGNAIFGQWTWSGQGIAPLDRETNKSHKILKFPILRASVKAYQNNLNTHKSYSKFRQKRFTLRDKNKKIKGLELTETLNNYAQTGSEYTKILNQIIRQNRLTDFEPVSLINSMKNIELSA